jgi:hypothetical protein
VEITPARWPANDAGGNPPAHSPNERRQPAVGSTADTRRIAQTRHRCRTDDGCKVHDEEKATAIARLESLPSQSCRWHRIDGFVRGADDLAVTSVSHLRLLDRRTTRHRRIDLPRGLPPAVRWVALVVRVPAVKAPRADAAPTVGGSPFRLSSRVSAGLCLPPRSGNRDPVRRHAGNR